MRRSVVIAALVLGLAALAVGWLVWSKGMIFSGQESDSWAEGDLPSLASAARPASMFCWFQTGWVAHIASPQ